MKKSHIELLGENLPRSIVMYLVSIILISFAVTNGINWLEFAAIFVAAYYGIVLIYIIVNRAKK